MKKRFFLTTILLINTLFPLSKSFSIEKWSQELSASPSLSPAVGDVDGDGYDEIVVGVGGVVGSGEVGGVEVFRYDGQREAGWPKDTDKNMMSSPALGDLDGDSINDIVICSNLGVHAYLSISPSWFKSAGTGGNDLWSLATPIIADLENDGQLEVLTINNWGTVYAWHNNGQPVIAGSNGVFAQAEESDPSLGFPCLAVADLDRNGSNEVIAGAANRECDYPPCPAQGGIYIWDINGHLLLKPGDYPDKLVRICGIAVTDIDADQNLEVIVFGANENCFGLFAFNKDGTQVNGYPIMLENLGTNLWFGNHPAIGDLDGDGTLEIVVSVYTPASCGRIYAWHQDGTPLRPNGSEDPVFAYICETSGSPILADVNGDGNVDIIARAGYFFGSGYERVFAWDYHGNPISGFPLEATEEPSSYTYSPHTPVVADMDKDGKLDMILTTDYVDTLSKARLVSWELDADYDTSKIPWPKYMHDKWNSGVFRKNYTGVEDKKKSLLPTFFSLGQNYPNPFNSQTAIEYNLPKASYVKIDIYNVLGQKVRTLVDQEENSGHKRVIWDGKNDRGETASSGMYFYRIEAKEGFVQTKKMLFLK